jgi:hypothetical protein
MNNDYHSPAPEPTNNNATVVQTQKEKNDFIFLDKKNNLEIVLPEKISVIDKKDKTKKNL